MAALVKMNMILTYAVVIIVFLSAAHAATFRGQLPGKCRLKYIN